jgi:hypothetical protein
MWLHSLAQGFPHLQSLDIHIHPRMPVMVGGLYRFTSLRNLSIMCIEISGAQDLLQSLAMGNPRSTIETISFVLLNDVTALGRVALIVRLMPNLDKERDRVGEGHQIRQVGST